VGTAQIVVVIAAVAMYERFGENHGRTIVVSAVLAIMCLWLVRQKE
jgi:hypothetical protein